MALAFPAGQWTINQWGVSAGDIAVLAGAGRAAVTWVTSHFKDRSLLEFLDINIEDLVPRKGIIDTTALHQRWDVRMTLLQNGQRRIIQSSSGPIIENMNAFSWFMTILTSVLDATLQRRTMRQALLNFLSKLFEEHIDELDYLRRNLPQHIEGWISAAVVRNIASQARVEWDRLLSSKLRLPGDIPEGDVPEIVRLLVWLAGGKGEKDSRQFETASSDAFAFAKVLQAIGLDIIEAVVEAGEDSYHALESKIIIKFNPSAIATGSACNEHGRDDHSRQRERSGIRIPLDCMQECVSVWPGTEEQNNQRRRLFGRGFAASETLSVKPSFQEAVGPGYLLSDKTTIRVGRADNVVDRIVSDCFPIPTPALIDNISQILAGMPYARDRGGQGIYRLLDETPEYLSKLQVFLLGYYYGMLRIFLDSTRLSIPEGYGSWKWFDTGLLRWIRMLISENGAFTESKVQRTRHFRQRGILKLIGLLFAGADEDQLRAVHPSSVGIHGKISVVASCLLGSVNLSDCVTDFCLLDTDPTAIPSNSRGIISSGIQDSIVKPPSILSDDDLRDVDHFNGQETTDDFTSHIEPDWENDVQQCQVAFRYNGRLVGRVAPTTLIESRQEIRELEIRHILPPLPSKFYVAKVDTLVSDRPQPAILNAKFSPDQPAIYIPTHNMKKARAFLAVQYNLAGYSRVKFPGSWPQIEENPERGRTDDSNSPIILYPDYNPNEPICRGNFIVLA